jgi:hypothetical protein
MAEHAALCAGVVLTLALSTVIAACLRAPLSSGGRDEDKRAERPASAADPRRRSPVRAVSKHS